MFSVDSKAQLFIQSTIIQTCQNVSWVQLHVVQRRIKGLARGHSTVPPTMFEPVTPGSQVKPGHLPPCSFELKGKQAPN